MTLSYDYMPAVLYAIDLISQGLTETEACDKSNIRIAVFKRYINDIPQLQELYAEADQRGADAMADALVSIDNHKHYGRSDPKMAKVISDNIKWVLSKRKVKQYGDRVVVEHSVTMDRAITDALIAARNRGSKNFLPSPTVEATFSEIEESDEEIMRQLLS
jgi:hypothetical protein